ncbi:MAG: flavodoxin family protein [Chloroflexi bacterium]|nr:flavodoxin family protein [Chloroflexota bacterium]
MNKIIVLNGGPRKRGNTFRIAEWVAQGARKKGAQVQIIHLVDHRIEHCRGCYACGHTGKCVIQDDHESICEQLEQAQGVIVCSPVFSGSYASILKTFIDRLTSLLGFTGRFAHLCSVGVTTARYDFTGKTAKEISSTINTSWSQPGYVTGYIHKSIIDTSKSQNLELSSENSVKLYSTAIQMGEKLVDDIAEGKRGALPFHVRMLFKYFVLPGIARILLNNQDSAQFLCQTMEEQGVINDAVREKHAAKMRRIPPNSEWKTSEKINFSR